MNAAFISYVSENAEIVDLLCQELKSRDIQVWRDRDEIAPGSRWKQEIRTAIREGTFFIACFSTEYNDRDKTYMNEELTIAIEELRQHPHDRIWFIPVKLNECEIPERNIGGVETMRDLHYVNLEENWDDGLQRILNVVRHRSSEPENANTSERPIEESAQAEFSNGMTYQNSAGESSSAREKRELFNKAIKHYSAALDLNPNYVEAYHARGTVYVFTGKIGYAIRDFSMAIELKPDYWVAYYNRGSLHRSDRRYEQSLKDFTKVIQLKPNLHTGYFERGEVYRLKGDFDRAIKDFNKAIQFKPDSAITYNH